MKKAFIAHSMLFNTKELAILICGSSIITEIEIPEHEELISCDKFFVNGDFVYYDAIEVQVNDLSNFIDPTDLHQDSGYFEVKVSIEENEDPILTIKDRNFKLEDLSMELQERIHKVANEMYADKMKTIVND